MSPGGPCTCQITNAKTRMKTRLIFAVTAAVGVLLSLAAFRSANESELTLLMRDIFDEAMTAKQAIAAGEEPKFEIDLNAILTAKATVDAKTNNPNFRPKAEAYLEAMEALKRSEPAQRIKAFNAVVDACMACHRSVCPGPMMRIDKLYFKNTD